MLARTLREVCFRAATSALFLLTLAVRAPAQQPGIPTVVFTLDFPGSDPAHYEIIVPADGPSHYSSAPKPDPSHESDPVGGGPATDDPYRADFTLSPATLHRIFDLTKRVDYFNGVLDSGKKNLASTGTKVLSYKAPGKNTSATYNYSQISAVQDLTSIFQNLSATLEFARRLDYDFRFQKTALDEELKKMEEMSGRGSLDDLSAASPILQKIASDPTVMNISRSRAQRLLSHAAASK